MSTTVDAAEPGPAPAAAPVPGGSAPPPRRAGSGRWRWIAVLAVIVGALVFLLVEGLGGSLNYFRTVDQAVAARSSIGGQEFRLEGTVVPGTIQMFSGGVRFVAAGKHDQVAVINHGAPGQLFCPGRQVVVDGRFTGRAGSLPLFDSHQLIVDHTQYYVAEHPGRVAETPCPGLSAAEQHP